MSEQCERVPFELKLNKLDGLKVYKAFKDFRTYAYLLIDKMPHWVKCSEGIECRRDIRECVVCLSVLCRSHDMQEKIDAINAFLAHIDCIYDRDILNEGMQESARKFVISCTFLFLFAV